MAEVDELGERVDLMLDHTGLDRSHGLHDCQARQLRGLLDHGDLGLALDQPKLVQDRVQVRNVDRRKPFTQQTDESGLAGRPAVPCVGKPIIDPPYAQVPAFGTKIPRDKCVDLLVSTGARPRTYKMPGLVGLSLDEAILSIETSGLALGEIKSIYRKNKPKNTIVNQEPLSGYRMIEGGIVNVVVNREFVSKDKEYPHGDHETGLFRYRLAYGFLKRHIRVQLSSSGISITLFDDYMKPGEEVWMLVPGYTDATLLLYEDGELLETTHFH